MNEKFTPGPWSVGTPRKMGNEHHGYTWWDVPVHVGATKNKGNALALVCMGGEGATSTSVLAVQKNAHLIAAAPEMYEALKKCAVAFSALYPATLIIRRNAEHENEEIVVADLLAEIRAALSKANGAQQEVERG